MSKKALEAPRAGRIEQAPRLNAYGKFRIRPQDPELSEPALILLSIPTRYYG
jgi:hypothetical protein